MNHSALNFSELYSRVRAAKSTNHSARINHLRDIIKFPLSLSFIGYFLKIEELTVLWGTCSLPLHNRCGN